MALPAPNLDDRRFQDLVDDAKRLVQQKCPEWTDHNVSDPGVTLIEVFAWMTDQLLYRLNRVPDRHYVKFLELIGVSLFPPNAARADVTFWLSAPQPTTITIPPATEVGTLRTETDESITFSTVEGLDIVPCSLASLKSTIEADQHRDHSEALLKSEAFHCFDGVPKPGDALYVGLSDPVPSCAVALRLDCAIEGVGVDPTDPPLIWEAWDGDEWVPCEVERDDTGGLNRAGDVVLHIPKSHEVSVIARQRAGWVRARVVEAHEDQPVYSSSPLIRAAVAMTVGGTVGAVNASPVDNEILGLTEGVPGQRFLTNHRPLVPGSEPWIVEVEGESGWEEWTHVTDFADSGPGDRHVSIDPTSGEVAFGPAVLQPDGRLQTFGQVPQKGRAVRLRAYLTGGGVRGNVSKGSIAVLKSAIPYVSRVENRRAAHGGRDGEDLENAKRRGPMALRTRGRAVTAEDFEEIARAASLDVARVRCVPAGEGSDPFGVRVLVVPDVSAPDGRLPFAALVPSDETMARVSSAIDERRLVGTRVSVETPEYVGITVVAQLRALPRTSATRLQEAALQELYRYYSPVAGGPDGNGWPFGRTLHVGEVYSVLQRVPGVGFVEDARVFGANPVTGERSREPSQRLELDRNQLIYSYEHVVMVLQ